ncbi:MAG: hypothetical protein WCA44_05760 [Acidobacteriaceae bacterium]
MGSPAFSAVNPMANPELNGWLSRRIDGKAMRALKVEREALLMSLKATGLAQPATIINFNPVPLSLDGGIGFKVPSIVDEAVRDENRFHYKHDGRSYRASVLTIKEPRVFPQIKDVKVEEGVESGVYDMKACKQIEIAHCFLVAYTSGTPSSSGMGGVVVFEGDRRLLERTEKKRIQVRVPQFVRLPNKTREYITEAADFDDLVAECLTVQKRYSNGQTQQAQNYWDQGDEERKNITTVHRTWHQFEMDMGYRQTPAPWITLSTENAKTCAGCGEPQKRVDAYFCHKCARPYEPFEAYKAGELGIEHPSLNRCDAKQWDEIRKIEAKRKALREGL